MIRKSWERNKSRAKAFQWTMLNEYDMIDYYYQCGLKLLKYQHRNSFYYLGLSRKKICFL